MFISLIKFFLYILGVDDLDFTRYPDKAYQVDWLRYYLEQYAIHRGKSPDTVTEKDVEECYVKTNKFALVRLNIFTSFF